MRYRLQWKIVYLKGLMIKQKSNSTINSYRTSRTRRRALKDDKKNIGIINNECKKKEMKRKRRTKRKIGVRSWKISIRFKKKKKKRN